MVIWLYLSVYFREGLVFQLYHDHYSENKFLLGEIRPLLSTRSIRFTDNSSVRRQGRKGNYQFWSSPDPRSISRSSKLVGEHTRCLCKKKWVILIRFYF